jgi:thiamine biosynthesis lipoprotein
MGTVFSFDVREPGVSADVLTDVIEWLHRMDDTFSTYRADSWISRLDRGEVRLVDGPDEVWHVLEACESFRRETGGYFDHYASGQLDPSGYVKGWAIETASDRLEAAGSRNHCVNGGGDVQCIGRPAADREWRVGISNPLHPQTTVATVSGERLAVATSGTAERGLHIVDPSNGSPVQTWASVTVVGTELTSVDVWATAAFAAGPKAIEWLTARGLSAALVDHAGTVTTV